MKQLLVLVGALSVFIIVLLIYSYVMSLSTVPAGLNYSDTISPTPLSIPTPTQIPLPVNYEIPGGMFVAQTFNNCGPATLSMAMSYWNVSVSQDVLGEKMRPYQHPTGDNDDKSVSVEEFVNEAKNYGLESLARPNGTVELVKKFVSNNIPVVVRTWLHPNEDIGHFRVVRGYDDTRGVFIQDDSYEGKNLTYDYDTFLSMWQPFNYGYIIVYPKDKDGLVRQILAEEYDENIAYENSILRSAQELEQNPSSFYSNFNRSTAYYHLGQFAESVQEFEKVENSLPSRMLWYQIEPIRAYKEVGNRQRVFSLTEKILINNNRAFSELYQLRGEIYLKQGNVEVARAEFEKALFYNNYFEEAAASLSSL